MARILKRIALAALVLCALMPLGGCFTAAVDELYSLPQLSEKYIQLQQLIDVELNKGAEYSAPTSGSYRQSVQLYDINGDGIEEALASFTRAGTLYICVYHAEQEDYNLALTIEGEGTSIGSVEYNDLNGDGWAELIVAWQIGTGMQILKVYSLVEFNSAVLLTTDSSQFTLADMTGNGISNLLVLRFDSAAGGAVEMYSIAADGETEQSAARLTPGLESIQRVRTGYLVGAETAALFVESFYDGGRLITDILTYDGGRIVNISADAETGVSLSTVRDYTVYSRDINNDRVLEVPSSELLPSLTEGGSNYWVFDWYAFGADSTREFMCSTYHCYNDGWYLTLPESWRDGFAVRREDTVTGERVVILSNIDDNGKVLDFLTIYTLTGENRRDRARLPDRFVLYEEGTTIYAAKLLQTPESWIHTLDQESVKALFRPIISEWITGAV